MAKGGSKLITAIISFLLGFLFAIIVEVGAIFGVCWFVVNKDLDTVFSTLGIQNTDENGNHKYIDTDKATNLKELFESLKGLIYEDGQITALGKSFEDFADLVPATNMLLGFVYDTVDDYIEIDREEFESTPISGLAQVLSNCIMDVKTAALLDKLGMDMITGEDANALVRSLVTGAECEYATIYYGGAQASDAEGGEASTFKLPVLYDYYTYDENFNSYWRVDDDSKPHRYPDNLASRTDWLCEADKKNEDGKALYMLYYVPCRVTNSGIEEAQYSFKVVEKTEGSGDNAKTRKFTVVEYGEDTDFIVVKPDADGAFIIDYEQLKAAEDGSAVNSSYRFTGYSYLPEYAENYYRFEKTEEDKWNLKTYCGKNYFRNNAHEFVQLDPLTLADIVGDPFSPLDYVAVVDVLGENSEVGYKVFGKTSLGALMRGDVDFGGLLDELEVSAFINNVAPDNSLMAYLVYRVSDMNRISDSYYEAVFDKFGDDEGSGRRVNVKVEGNHIEAVYETNGSVIEGVKVKELASLAANMTINTVMDVSADNAIMSYIGYGVYGLEEGEAGAEDELGNAYDYAGKVNVGGTERVCYITAKSNEDNTAKVITSVWYIDGGNAVEVKGTKISEVSERVDTFKRDLSIGDVLGLDNTDNKLLQAIKDTKIDGLENKISDLCVNDIIGDSEINGSALLKQISGAKISELAQEIDNVLIQRLYAKEVYQVENEDPVLAEDYHADWLYYVVDGDGFKLDDTNAKDETDETKYDDALGHLTEEQFESGTYYTYGAAQGMWKLILYKDGAEKAYTMNNFNNMVAATTSNINKATLGELQEAGVINATKEQLAKKFRIVYNSQQCYIKADGNLTVNESEGVTLGEMKLADLIDVVVKYLLAT